MCVCAVFYPQSLASTRDSRTVSPRRLTKQVALESPPNQHQTEDQHITGIPHHRGHDTKHDKSNSTGNKEESYRTQRQRLRKIGPFAVDSQSIPDSRTQFAGAWAPTDPNRDDSDGEDDDDDTSFRQQSHTDRKQSSLRIGDDCVCHRCTECGVMLEEYSDEEIGIMVIILGTFIHREAALAAPFLPEILAIVTK